MDYRNDRKVAPEEGGNENELAKWRDWLLPTSQMAEICLQTVPSPKLKHNGNRPALYPTSADGLFLGNLPD